MANPEHLKLVKTWVNLWNQWRKEYPNVKVDLSGADLREANLSEANLSQVNLCNADLYKANLNGTTFWEADLREADLDKAELNGADLRRARLCKATLRQASLRLTNLNEADLCEADLCEVSLRGALLDEAILVGANLSGANLGEINLKKVDLHRVILNGIDFSGRDFSGKDFSNSTFRGAKFSGANLSKTNFTEADITGVKLYSTARDNWIIDGIICDYVFWDEYGKKRTPPDRDFQPGEFEELYKALPTFDYYFKHGFTPIDAVVMDRVVQAINEQHPEFELKLDSFHSRGRPHAVFTVVHKDHLEEAQQQVTTDFEQRLAALEGKQEQMMELFARIADNPKTIELIMGDKRMIQASRDYVEHIEGDVTTGESVNESKQPGEREDEESA